MVVEAGGQSSFGIFMHSERANLKFNNLFVWSDDGGVETLVPIWLWNSDIVFNTRDHWLVHAVKYAECTVAVLFAFDNNTECHEVVDIINIAANFLEFLVQAVDTFDSSVNFKVNALLLQL
ncbi:hypothetical protein D3C72_1043780 [compost metagenome]